MGAELLPAAAGVVRGPTRPGGGGHRVGLRWKALVQIQRYDLVQLVLDSHILT